MADERNFGSLDVSDFTVGAMLRSGIAIRRAVRGASTMEGAAGIVVRYFYDHCLSAETGTRACALVRFYKTHRYGALEPALKLAAAAKLGDGTPRDDVRCLALLATVGDEDGWNSRHRSRDHKVIPLPSADVLRSAPMILRLVEELGIDVESLVSAAAPVSRASDPRTYEVFHVEEALGSPVIPAQHDFVVRYGIASVVGFGGLLRSGEMFAVILFSRQRIPIASATRFRTIALDIRSALFPFDEEHTWGDA
jgi:hypothetical protein